MGRDLRETLHYSSKDEKSLKAKELWDLPKNLKTQLENFSVGDAGFCHLKGCDGPSWFLLQIGVAYDDAILPWGSHATNSKPDKNRIKSLG